MLDDDISKATRNVCLTYNKNENKRLGMNGLKKQKRFKTHMKHLIKYLNQCFQQGFSKNLEISRKRGMGFARSRFSLKFSIFLKTPHKTLSLTIFFGVFRLYFLQSFFFVGEVWVIFF